MKRSMGVYPCTIKSELLAQPMDESFAQPLRSPAVSLVETDPEALEAAEDMMGEQFSWLAALLNHFADKRGFDAVCKVIEPSSSPQSQKRINK
jgi:hypothetical protein